MLFSLGICSQERHIGELWHEKSGRGVELSLNFVASPSGGVTLPVGNGHIWPVFGGEAILAYRINNCMSVGVAATPEIYCAGGLYDYQVPVTLRIKVNIKDCGKFVPYVSLNMGFELTYWAGTGNNILDYNVVAPACGLDFPVRRGSFSTELRFECGIPDYIIPQLAVGYTF